MKSKTIKSIEEYISQVLSLSSAAILGSGSLGKVILEYNEDGSLKVNDKNEVIIRGAYPDSLLFRGQFDLKPLIPKLGRVKGNSNIERIEQSLIDEIKRRGDKLVKGGSLNIWDLLVYVQHYGLATRLLDWTTNPLIALWFACQNEEVEKPSYVFVFKYSEEHIVNTEKNTNPFKIKETKVFKPNLNNDRIIAQNGWFTVHAFNQQLKKFTPLELEKEFEDRIWVIEIPADNKTEILAKLDILGVNFETIYPGIEGTCRYINWMNLED